jgi:hypothetical protein
MQREISNRIGEICYVAPMTRPACLTLAPLVFGVALGGLLRLSFAASVAKACDCASDAFWVLGDVVVDGPAVQWPKDGHLYPDNLNLWAEGFSAKVPYK